MPVSEDIEQLPLIELHRNRVDMPQPTSHDTAAKTAGQGLNDAVLQQVVSGNSMEPYRGAQLGEHVEIDASAITSLEQIYAPETALRVDTRTFTPANGAPDDRTVQGYMEYVARAGSVENVPQNHRRIVLGEMYTERSINLGDQVRCYQPKNERKQTHTHMFTCMWVWFASSFWALSVPSLRFLTWSMMPYASCATM